MIGRDHRQAECEEAERLGNSVVLGNGEKVEFEGEWSLGESDADAAPLRTDSD